jgi:osmotically inducible protein OsmC
MPHLVVGGGHEPRASWTSGSTPTAKNIKKEINQMNTTKTSQETSRADQPQKALYTGKVHTTGGRDGGGSRSSDGRLDVKLTFPGTPGTGTNPEQLLAAGWSACFLTNLKIAGGKKKINVSPEATVDAEVDLCPVDEGFALQARLNVNLPGSEREAAQSLVDIAHQACPYSKATRGNVDVVISLV